MRDLRKALWFVEDLTGAGKAFHRTGAQVANAQSLVIFLVQGHNEPVRIVRAKSVPSSIPEQDLLQVLGSRVTVEDVA